MENETQPEIFWTKSASQTFKKALAFIEEDSPKAASRFKEKIEDAINAIPENPERYPPDRSLPETKQRKLQSI